MSLHETLEVIVIHWISLKRHSSLGPSPAFTVKLSRGGLVEYEGTQWVPKLGQVTTTLPPRSFSHLAGLVKRTGFWDMKTSYFPDPFTTCLAAVTVSVGADELVKSVYDYGGSGPQSLTAIANSIDARVRRHVWDGRRAAGWKMLFA